MNISTSPTSPRALIAELVQNLSLAGRTGDFESFDELIQSAPTIRRLRSQRGAAPVTLDLNDVAEGFQRERCSIPREKDLQEHRLVSNSAHTPHGGAGPLNPPPSHLEHFATRALKLMCEAMTAGDKGYRTLRVEPGMAKVCCGILAFHARYDGFSLNELMSPLQLLQGSLDGELSEEFHNREKRWADFVAVSLNDSTSVNDLLHDSALLFRKGNRDEATAKMNEYVRSVQETVHSFPECGSEPRLRISAYDAYKYAFLFGIIDQSKFTELVVWVGGAPEVRKFDASVLRSGALLAARAFAEYTTISELVPRAERELKDIEPPRLSAYELTGHDDSNPYHAPGTLYADDYWKIAAPLMAARMFRRNPQEGIALSPENNYQGPSMTSYLAGIKYIPRFAKEAMASDSAATAGA